MGAGEVSVEFTTWNISPKKPVPSEIPDRTMPAAGLHTLLGNNTARI